MGVKCLIEVKFQGIDTKKRITVEDEMNEVALVHLLQSTDDQEFQTTANFGIQPLSSETATPTLLSDDQHREVEAVILDGKQDSMLIYVVIGVCAVLALLIGGLVMYLRRAGKAKAGGKQNTPITVSVTERITATA